VTEYRVYPRRLGQDPATAPDYPRVKLRLQFKPRDCWIGLYWQHRVQGWDGGWWESWTFRLCLLPMLPLQLDVDRSLRETRAYKQWKAARS